MELPGDEVAQPECLVLVEEVDPECGPGQEVDGFVAVHFPVPEQIEQEERVGQHEARMASDVTEEYLEEPGVGNLLEPAGGGYDEEGAHRKPGGRVPFEEIARARQYDAAGQVDGDEEGEVFNERAVRLEVGEQQEGRQHVAYRSLQADTVQVGDDGVERQVRPDEPVAGGEERREQEVVSESFGPRCQTLVAGEIADGVEHGDVEQRHGNHPHGLVEFHFGGLAHEPGRDDDERVYPQYAPRAYCGKDDAFAFRTFVPFDGGCTMEQDNHSHAYQA